MLNNFKSKIRNIIDDIESVKTKNIEKPEKPWRNGVVVWQLERECSQAEWKQRKTKHQVHHEISRIDSIRPDSPSPQKSLMKISTIVKCSSPLLIDLLIQHLQPRHRCCPLKSGSNSLHFSTTKLLLSDRTLVPQDPEMNLCSSYPGILLVPTT